MDDDLEAIINLYTSEDDSIEPLILLFGGDISAFIAAPGNIDTTRAPSASPKPASKSVPKGPSAAQKSKESGQKSGLFDPAQHPQAPAGAKGGKGGQFIPKGSGGGAGKKTAAKKSVPAKKAAPPKQSKSQRVAHLMEGILKALGPLMAQLSGPQVQALMEKIKKNAEAFINGQANAPHHGGGGRKSGGSKATPGGKAAPGSTAKKTASPSGGTKNSPSSSGTGQSPGGGGGQVNTALIKSVINSVQNLLKGFGQQMKPEQRQELQKAIRGLQNMASVEAEQYALFEMAALDFANGASTDPENPSISFMALPHDDTAVHAIGPEEKHATLTYFGEPDESDDGDRLMGSKALMLNCAKVAAAAQPPFSAAVKSVEPLGDNGAQVWILDSPELQSLHEALGGGDSVDSELDSMYEDSGATKYPEYTPHVTIGYQGSEDEPALSDDDVAAAQGVTEIPFDKISLWWGDERHDFPLGG